MGPCRQINATSRTLVTLTVVHRLQFKGKEHGRMSESIEQVLKNNYDAFGKGNIDL